jgi:hypothetical protein
MCANTQNKLSCIYWVMITVAYDIKLGDGLIQC